MTTTRDLSDPQDRLTDDEISFIVNMLDDLETDLPMKFSQLMARAIRVLVETERQLQACHISYNVLRSSQPEPVTYDTGTCEWVCACCREFSDKIVDVFPHAPDCPWLVLQAKLVHV